MVCGPLPETFNTDGPCSSIKIPSFVLALAISQQSYLVKTSARGPQREVKGLVEKPCPGQLS